MNRYIKVSVLAAGLVFCSGVLGAQNSTVDSEGLSHRTEINVSNSLYGQLSGLQVLQNAGASWNNGATLYIRGLGTLTGKTPLIIVDGFERSLSELSSEEIESVTVLKDPVALSLYGGRGANGVVYVKTKKGMDGKPKIGFSYSYILGTPTNMPEFVDGQTYAMAMNEALVNDGLAPRYSSSELKAFADLGNPDVYPDTDWWGEGFRNHSSGHKATFTIQGGNKIARYFAVMDYINDSGILKPVNENEGYSTQFKYSKMNIRTNLEVDVTRSTLLTIHLLGNFSENNRPGTTLGDFFKAFYQVPSGVFPVKTENGVWGGSTTYSNNPIAQLAGSGYARAQGRTLYADLALKQSLAVLTPGLSASLSLALDNTASYWDSNTISYGYESATLSGGENSYKTLREEGAMSFGTKLGSVDRRTAARASVDYERVFSDRHDVSASLLYSMDQSYSKGQNQSFSYMDVIGHVRYAYDKRYIIDAAVSGSASSVLEPGHRWCAFPSASFTWAASQEGFLRGSKAVSLLQFRAAFGMAGMANYTYDLYKSKYGAGNSYYFKYPPASNSGSKEKQLAVDGLTYEKTHNTDIGFDLSLFNCFYLTVDGFYNHRTDILVDNGSMSTVLGISAPKTNSGIVNNRGVEVSARYTGTKGDFHYDLGGNFSFTRSKIMEMCEAYKPYDYLKRTGGSLNQIFGYEVIGIYRTQSEIDNNTVKQNLSDVQPGDYIYKDQNGDNVIDEYDKIPLGYNSLCPEIYYGFNLCFEYKGFGIYAMFQGAGNYSQVLDTRSVFRPLVDNNTISKYYYENRWTPENQNAIYPRLTANGSDNNYVNNSVWVQDASYFKLRTLDIYYKFPANLISKAKMTDLKLFARGYDLFSIDSTPVFDAEAIGEGHPLMRQYTFGVSVAF